MPAVEYLQYLVARTEPNTSGAEPTQEEWEAVWQLALDALRLTQQYLFTRKNQTSPPSEMDGLRFIVDHALTIPPVSSATLTPSSDASPPADFAVTLPVLSEASTRTPRAEPRGAPPAWPRPRRAMRWAPPRARGHEAGGWVRPRAGAYGVETSSRAPSGTWSLDRGSTLKTAADIPAGAPRVNGSGRLVSDPSTRPSLLPLAPSTERSWGTRLRHRS